MGDEFDCGGGRHRRRGVELHFPSYSPGKHQRRPDIAYGAIDQFGLDRGWLLEGRAKGDVENSSALVGGELSLKPAFDAGGAIGGAMIDQFLCRRCVVLQNRGRGTAVEGSNVMRRWYNTVRSARYIQHIWSRIHPAVFSQLPKADFAAADS